MSKKIYIDGSHGTTGLEIEGLLSKRSDLSILRLNKLTRNSSIEERLEMIRHSDATVLCLPNAASENIVSSIKKEEAFDDKPIIDTSSQFRLDPEWVYGLPELGEIARRNIAKSKRVANVGCHASAFILVVKPLIEAKFISKKCTVTAVSQTGYSGGGASMIQQYKVLQSQQCSEEIGPVLYNLQSNHKHLDEMRYCCDLDQRPIFMPVVSNFYRGLCLSVGFNETQIISKNDIHQECFNILESCYAHSPLVRVFDQFSVNTLKTERISANINAGNNFADIFVTGSGDTVQITLAMDNLRKGAATTAIQNLNLMLGIYEYEGLL